MTLPVSARVEAAPNFIGNLEEARLFLIEQDAESATERFRKLKAELREMVTVLGWSPGRGRLARFLSGRSVQARLRVEAVQQLAAQAGLPYLREYITNRHVVLYAHSATDVVLLALKHQRQLTYSTEGE